jgi:hypothetical protein
VGLSITLFTDTTTILASDIRSKINEIETFVNEGIVQGDLKTSTPWVNTTLVYGPEFYGSPSPRTEMVSGDTWQRFTPRGRENFAIYHGDLTVDTFIPVHGLSATVRNPRDSSVEAFVMMAVYAYSQGTESGAYSPYEKRAARLRLQRNDAVVTGTLRKIYAQGSVAARVEGAENYSLIAKTTLSPGTHQMSVRISVDDPPAGPDWKHVFLAARSLVIDVPHLAA